MSTNQLAKEIVKVVRNNKSPQGAEIAVYVILATWENTIKEISAMIAGFHAEQERLKGAGTMLRRDKGEATDADVKLYTWRYNLARDIERDIRAGKIVSLLESPVSQDNEPPKDR